MIIVASVLLVLAVAVVAMAFIGAFRWKAGTAALSGVMEGARVRTGVVENYDSREIEDLPPPVQRYFRAVLEDGQPLVAAVRVEHVGTFNMSGDGEKWKPFTSTQRVVVRRPGFIWDARVRMAPGMRVFVHDAYVAGHGFLEAKLFGLLTVMKEPPDAGAGQGRADALFCRGGLVSHGPPAELGRALGGD